MGLVPVSEVAQRGLRLATCWVMLLMSSQFTDERHSNRGANLRWFVYYLVWAFKTQECLWHYQQACIQSTLRFEHQRSQCFGDLIMEFINYVRSFYGPGGIYDMKATDEMIIDATIHYITEGGYKFCGDSFDREHVRDIMIERFGLVAVWELAQGGLQCPPIRAIIHLLLRNTPCLMNSGLRFKTLLVRSSILTFPNFVILRSSIWMSISPLIMTIDLIASIVLRFYFHHH